MTVEITSEVRRPARWGSRARPSGRL